MQFGPMIVIAVSCLLIKCQSHYAFNWFLNDSLSVYIPVNITVGYRYRYRWIIKIKNKRHDVLGHLISSVPVECVWIAATS